MAGTEAWTQMQHGGSRGGGHSGGGGAQGGRDGHRCRCRHTHIYCSRECIELCALTGSFPPSIEIIVNMAALLLSEADALLCCPALLEETLSMLCFCAHMLSCFQL